MTTGTAYLLVAIAGTECALPRGAVREILPLPRLWRPPGAPGALAGFLNLAGSAVPVVDLAVLFGLGQPGTAIAATNRAALYRHLILLRGESPLACSSTGSRTSCGSNRTGCGRSPTGRR